MTLELKVSSGLSGPTEGLFHTAVRSDSEMQQEKNIWIKTLHTVCDTDPQRWPRKTFSFFFLLVLRGETAALGEV